jgi:transcriptional regulator with XRE-family HTH domain
VHDVGSLLRHWRTNRRLSQQELANDAEISARHLSCLETGRSRPSREMLLVLSSALEIPLRERNTLLLAGGFAPAYRATDLDDPSMASVRHALDHLMRGAEPYGALVMNHRWDLLLANRTWHRVASLLLGRPLRVGENMLALVIEDLSRFLVHPDGLVRAMLQRLHREAIATADPDLHGLLTELEALPSTPADWRKDAWIGTQPVALTVDLEVAGQRLSMFTTLTTLGTPTDVNLSQLRIEHYFPADEATDAFLRSLA